MPPRLNTASRVFDLPASRAGANYLTTSEQQNAYLRARDLQGIQPSSVEPRLNDAVYSDRHLLLPTTTMYRIPHILRQRKHLLLLQPPTN